MAANVSHSVGHEPLRASRDGRRHLNTSPKTSRKRESQKQTGRKMKQTPGPGANGDVVSDEESPFGDDGGEGGAVGHDEHDGDQPAVFALSGHMSTGSSATSPLTGPNSDDVFDDYERTVYDSVLNDDDDEDEHDYAGVADISDEEELIVDEDEDSFLRLAETDLIEEFERTEKPRNAAAVTNRVHQMQIQEDPPRARRLTLDSEDSQYELDMNFDLSEDPFRGLSSRDALYKEMIEDAEVAFDDELTRWRMPESTRSRENSVQSISQKKVRFESTPSRASSMSSEDDPRDAYPDLFADLDGPVLRPQRVSGAMEIDTQDLESVYDFDFDDEYDKVTADADGESDSADDDGDTTDEETVDEQLARMRAMQKAKGKSTEHISVSHPPAPADKSGSRSAPVSRRTSSASVFETPKPTKKPKSGTFVHDPTRATVSADIRGSGVKLVCPTNPPEKDRAYWERARAAISSRDGSPRAAWTRTTPQAPSIPQRPLTVKSTLGTLFDGNLDFLRNNDVAGIAGDLLLSAGPLGPQSSFTSATLTEDDASDGEENVNMADFVQMGDSDSDMDEPMSAGGLPPAQSEYYSDYSLVSSPIQRRGSGGPGLLDHLEQQRGLVTSFRTNQTRARHFSSLASNPNRRAKMSEQNALQAGRRNAANTPMTPARKKRGSQDLTSVNGSGIKKANASPMVTRRRQSRGNSLSGIHQTLSLDRFAPNGNGP